jgi:hypothetical protein
VAAEEVEDLLGDEVAEARIGLARPQAPCHVMPGARPVPAVAERRLLWRLPAGADSVQNIHAEQEQMFMDESGLARTRPDARIRFSRPAGYLELLENVQIHGYRLIVGLALRAAHKHADSVLRGLKRHD